MDGAAQHRGVSAGPHVGGRRWIVSVAEWDLAFGDDGDHAMSADDLRRIVDRRDAEDLIGHRDVVDREAKEASEHDSDTRHERDFGPRFAIDREATAQGEELELGPAKRDEGMGLRDSRVIDSHRRLRHAPDDGSWRELEAATVIEVK